MMYAFDIDYTLANGFHREPLNPHNINPQYHFLKAEQKAQMWRDYHAGIEDDPIIEATVGILKALHSAGHRIAIVTGRAEEYRISTVNWLTKNRIPYEILLMRPDGNFSSNAIIKQKHLEDLGGTDTVAALFEDYEDTAEHLIGLGYTVYKIG